MLSDYERAKSEILHIHRPEKRGFSHFDARCFVCDVPYPCPTVVVFQGQENA